ANADSWHFGCGAASGASCRRGSPVTLGDINGFSDTRSVSVKGRKEGKWFGFSARVGEKALAILRQSNGRAWLVESVTRRSWQQGCEPQDLVVASVRTRCES